MRRLAFLDRDGLLNEDVGYPHRLDQLHVKSDTINLLKYLTTKKFEFIVITNQSGVARGYFELHDVQAFNRQLTSIYKANGILLNKFYICPHHKSGIIKEYSIECECRKPKCALFLRASKEYSADLENSIAIGDKVRDLIPASQIGIGNVFLVSNDEDEIKKFQIYNKDVAKSVLVSDCVHLQTLLMNDPVLYNLE